VVPASTYYRNIGKRAHTHSAIGITPHLKTKDGGLMI